MGIGSAIQSRIRGARKRGAWLVKLIDTVRPALSAQGRGELCTSYLYGDEVHQTTSVTAYDRYPDLMALAAKLRPNARRILSFGCSTGEELSTLRSYFPSAEIVGAEINPRSRGIAERRVAHDERIAVLAPGRIQGSFDLIFALAVLQREPHMILQIDADDLSAHYPFDRFDKAVIDLVERLRPGGLFCAFHAHYPIEESTGATKLEAIDASPVMEEPLFGRDGRRLSKPEARSIFQKRSA